MRPIHSGEVLREEFLVPLGMSSHALSQAIHVPATRLNDIVNGKRGVTADTALRLARYFGNSGEFWVNLQGAGHWSLRVNDQFRICFRWTGGDAEDVEIVDYH
jgi:addiction module HigA family antidote